MQAHSRPPRLGKARRSRLRRSLDEREERWDTGPERGRDGPVASLSGYRSILTAGGVGRLPAGVGTLACRAMRDGVGLQWKD